MRSLGAISQVLINNMQRLTREQNSLALIHNPPADHPHYMLKDHVCSINKTIRSEILGLFIMFVALCWMAHSEEMS